jgi:hypothetical protein
MRAFVTINELSRLSGRDVRCVRRELAAIEPAAILLSGSAVVALFDVGVAESLAGIRMRPIQLEIQHTTGKENGRL